MEVHILAVQARVLMWVGLAWLAVGIYLGFDPVTVVWRATLAAFVAMWVTGKLLKILVGVISERMTSDLAARELKAEEARAAAVAAAAAPPKPTAPARPLQAPAPANRPAAPPKPATAGAPAPAPAPAGQRPQAAAKPEPRR